MTTNPETKLPLRSTLHCISIYKTWKTVKLGAWMSNAIGHHYVKLQGGDNLRYGWCYSDNKIEGFWPQLMCYQRNPHSEQFFYYFSFSETVLLLYGVFTLLGTWRRKCSLFATTLELHRTFVRTISRMDLVLTCTLNAGIVYSYHLLIILPDCALSSRFRTNERICSAISARVAGFGRKCLSPIAS